jgi:hypothetical protein
MIWKDREGIAWAIAGLKQTTTDLRSEPGISSSKSAALMLSDLSLQANVIYLRWYHNHLLSYPYLLTINDHFPILFDAV